MTDAPTPLLEVDEVSVRFGAVQALERVSLEIRRGEIVAIIGPNGAGKTTLLNVVSGFYHPSEGHLRFEGSDRQARGRVLATLTRGPAPRASFEPRIVAGLVADRLVTLDGDSVRLP